MKQVYKFISEGFEGSIATLIPNVGIDGSSDQRHAAAAFISKESAFCYKLNRSFCGFLGGTGSFGEQKSFLATGDDRVMIP